MRNIAYRRKKAYDHMKKRLAKTSEWLYDALVRYGELERYKHRLESCPKNCSCHRCGNKRKNHGPSMQEKREREKFS